MRCEKCGTELQIGMFPFCKGQARDHGAVPPKTAVFPFDTPHVAADGKPITIHDIGHLRRVERDYGVVLSVFSNEPSNPSNIRDLPKYRGEHPDNRRR